MERPIQLQKVARKLRSLEFSAIVFDPLGHGVLADRSTGVWPSLRVEVCNSSQFNDIFRDSFAI